MKCYWSVRIYYEFIKQGTWNICNVQRFRIMQLSLTHWGGLFSCVGWDYHSVWNDGHKLHTCTVAHQCESSGGASGRMNLYSCIHTGHICREFHRYAHACVSSDHQLECTYTRTYHTCREFPRYEHAVCGPSDGERVYIDTHTPHIWMEVPLYESTCELSSHLLGWNISHIQYTWRVVPSCEFVHVFLSCFVVWNFYHNARMWRVYYQNVFWDDFEDIDELQTSFHTCHIGVSSVYHHRLH